MNTNRFSQNGILGFINILYTPSIMIVAQVIIILPIIISVSTELLQQIFKEYKENFKIVEKKISYDDFVKLASEKK